MAEPAEVLEHLIENYPPEVSGGFNEAKTRLLIIDTVLSDVLGWSKTSFEPESPVASVKLDGDGPRKVTSWLDYHLADPSTPQRLVVEAKKTGTTFALRKKHRRDDSLVGLLRNHGTHLTQVLEQARTYCQNSGTDAFLVTNGVQWIGSIAFAQTVPLESLRAVVFSSLKDIYDNLGEFMDLFSPEGIASRHLAQRATGTSNTTPKFAARVHRGNPLPQASDQNYLAAPLRMLMSLCFDDLTGPEHERMLEACYVATDTADAGLRQLEALVGANLPAGLETSSRLNRFEEAENPFPKPTGIRGGTVLLAGRAGSGKSTFLALTRRRLTAKLAEYKHVVLLCDLLDKTEIHARHFVHDAYVSEVAHELLLLAERELPELSPFENKNLREIFNREISRREASMEEELRDTPFAAQAREEVIQKHLAEPTSHLKAYLGYLDRLGYTTTVLLDNVDRGTEEFERVTFQFASQLGRNSRATVVVALRDSTIQKGKRLDFLDVRQSPIVTLVSPPFLEVARKRFEYATKKLEEDPALWRQFKGALDGQDLPRVLEFAHILAEMVLRENSPVAQMINALSATNIRQALEMLTEFSISPWTDLNGMFRRYRANTVGAASSSDFLRSIMKRNKRRYIEDESAIILNLFRADTGRLVSHFLPVRILQFLDWTSRNAARPDVELSQVVAVFSGMGYPASDVQQAIDHLGMFGLVGSLSRAEPPWMSDDTVRLGSAGRYYLTELLHHREYLFNVIDDTAIYDAEVFANLERAERNKEQSFIRRLEDRLEIFLQYLQYSEAAELHKLGGQRASHGWLEEVSSVALARSIGSRTASRSKPKRRG